jgi:outer membrane receptor protein involved in Fe transport
MFELFSQHRRNAVFFAFLVAITLLFGPPNALAQQSSAVINGTIKDSTGAAIQGASIALTNTSTSVTRTAVSNSAGTYTFVDVQPATYTIKVSMDGFTSVTQEQVTLNVNQTATFDFSLTVGSTQQSVTVEASAAALESSTSELGTVINQKAVEDLPLNGRNFTQLLTLTPGASPVSVAQNSGGGGGFAGNAIGSFSFPALNGQRNRSNMFLVDGVVDLGSFIGNYNVQPIIDTVQEFKVQSHNDLAEFGQAPGGIVNVVTKSGSNQYHVTLWEFLRNQQLDARNTFAATRNALRQNQFGVAGGGPVWIPKLYNGRNRTFFFAGYEGFRQSVASQNTGLVPTQAQLNGDFSASSNVIYNPATLLPTGNGGYTAAPFAGNIIPSSQINALSAAYVKANFPVGPPVASGTNYIDNSPTHLDQDTWHIRVDQNFGEHDSIFGRVSEYNEPQIGSNGYVGAANFANDYGGNGAIHWVHTFNPTTVLDSFFGRNLGWADTGGELPGVPSNFASQLVQLGLSNNFVGGFGGGVSLVPSFSAAGYLGGQGESRTDTNYSNTWTFGGNFTKIVGRHTLKMGATFSTNNYNGQLYQLSQSFTATPTQNPVSAAGSGDSLASLLLGYPDGANRRNTPQTEHGGWVNGGYVQDTIKINSRLTLNIGLRYDVTLWPIYAQVPGNTSYVGDINLANGTYIIAEQPPACSATQGYPCIPGGTLPEHVVLTTHSNHSIYSNDYSNWQPRAGLAYRLTDKTALRAGYGRFYDNWNSIIQLAQNYEGTWPDIGQLIAQNLNHPGGVQAPIGDPFNQGSSPIVYPTATPFLSSGFVNWYVDPSDYKMPFSEQWNIGVEQGLGANTILSLDYVGSHSLRLNQGAQGNTSLTPGPVATEAERRPYPYITPTFYDQSVGQSKYNAFQFRLQQRPTRGLTYIISYTYSKSIDTGCSGSFGAEGCEIQTPYNYENDRSVSGFDLPHIFSGSFVYEIPVGKGKAYSTGNKFADYLIGNWQIGGILTLHSGLPFDVTVSNGDTAGTGNIVERANLASSNVYANASNPNDYLNAAAFSTPPLQTYGDLGRNSLRSPSYHNFDLSLTRNFPIKEIANLEFRVDAFNLTNSVVLGIPNSTLGDANFGVITGTSNVARQIQFAMKLRF